MNCKIEMAVTHRVSLLFIILISGFKLGITAPADAPPKGEDRPIRLSAARTLSRSATNNVISRIGFLCKFISGQ